MNEWNECVNEEKVVKQLEHMYGVTVRVCVRACGLDLS